MPPPRGGGRLLRNLSDKNTLSEASLSGQNNPENLTPEVQAKAELDANILAGGGLGLDPENDPIVATTDWGLDIYFHNAGQGTWKSSISTNGSVTTDALKGYLYFQGGTYNGVSNLKWVIIGYSTNTASAGPVNPNNVSNNTVFPDTTDAGTLIKNYASKGMVYVNSYKSPTFTNAVGNAEIPAGCVLCISEKNLLDAKYQSSFSTDAGDGYYKGARWVKSDLRTTMSNLCTSGITSFDTIRAKIQTVSLNTYSCRMNVSDYSEAIGKDTSSDKFFALANSTTNFYSADQVAYNTSTYPQNYCIETYLGNYANRAKRISYTHNTTTKYYWWLRTGNTDSITHVFIVDTLGAVTNAHDYARVTGIWGVRPAFVLKL